MWQKNSACENVWAEIFIHVWWPWDVITSTTQPSCCSPSLGVDFHCSVTVFSALLFAYSLNKILPYLTPYWYLLLRELRLTHFIFKIRTGNTYIPFNIVCFCYELIRYFSTFKKTIFSINCFLINYILTYKKSTDSVNT